jgi:ABC-type dipeptide/oligopeptide/nickel transport system permease subunit
MIDLLIGIAIGFFAGYLTGSLVIHWLIARSIEQQFGGGLEDGEE